MIKYAFMRIEINRLRPPEGPPEAETTIEAKRIGSRRQQFFNCGNSLFDKVNIIFPDKPDLENNIDLLLGAATSMLVDNVLEKQKGSILAQRLALAKLNMSGDIYYKIGKYSLADIVSSKDINPLEFLKSSVEATLTIINSYGNGDIKDSIQSTYDKVDLKKQNVAMAYGKFASALNLTLQDLNLLNSLDTRGKEKEIISKAREIVRKISKIRENFFNDLFDTNSPNFPLLKNFIEEYLSSPDKHLLEIMLERAGFRNIEKLYLGYRNAVNFSVDENEHSIFYKKLASALKDYSKSFFSRPLTIDDAEVLINESCGGISPSISGLKNICEEIFRHSIRPEFALDPNQIDLPAFKNANRIALRFPQPENSNNFNLNLSKMFDNTIELAFDVNIKRGKLDWSFLEDSSDPKMQKIKDFSLQYIRQILLAVKSNLEKEDQEKKTIASTNVSTKPEWVPRKNVGKPEKPKPILISNGIVLGKIQSPIKKEIKDHILVPSDEEFAEMTDGFSTKNKDKIRKTIMRINKAGIGKLKPLKLLYERKKVSERRIDKYRILVVEEDSSSDGKREYGIIEIGKRADIFKKGKKNHKRISLKS